MTTSQNHRLQDSLDLIEDTSNGPQLGQFETGRTLHIDGQLPGFYLGQRQVKMKADKQYVFTIIEKRYLLRRSMSNKPGERLRYNESRSSEFLEDSRRQVTIPAGHEFQLIMDNGKVDSFFVANVIDGSPFGPGLPPRVMQLRFFFDGRVQMTAYSAQGKAQIVRVSPDELRVATP